MQDDGNLVLYKDGNQALWAIPHGGDGLSDDGDAV